MEQLQSALQDRGLMVSYSPDKGRCLFTSRDFYPGLSLSEISFFILCKFHMFDLELIYLSFDTSGEVILSQEPYVCVSNNSYSESKCDGCFAAGKLKKCSACQVVWYCGSDCQVREMFQFHYAFSLHSNPFVFHLNLLIIIFRSWSGGCIALNAKFFLGLTRTGENLLPLLYVSC